MSDATARRAGRRSRVRHRERGVELTVKRIGEGPAVLQAGGLGSPASPRTCCKLPQALLDAGFQVIAHNARHITLIDTARAVVGGRLGPRRRRGRDSAAPDSL